MKLLEQKIMQEGLVKGSSVLDVGGFLNPMIDTSLIDKLAEEMYYLFQGSGITKVLTIESAGIPIACFTAKRLGVPALFAAKTKKEDRGSEYLTVPVPGSSVYITVPRKYISRNDIVMIVDDFLGIGNATGALVDIVGKAGASLAGVGIMIERQYLGGGDKIRNRGIRVEALAKILSQDDEGNIVFE